MQISIRSIAAASAVLLLLAGCGPAADRPAAAPQGASGSAEASAVFPDFQVKTFDGQTVALSRYRGKVVILDLFATWCPPCKMEIPEFVALQKQYADRLAVVGLSYDQGAVDPVKKFVQDMKINYDVYWGSQEIADFVGLRGIPTTLVLDPEGRVQRKYVGYTPKATFEQDVLALSAETQPAAAPRP